MKSTEQSAFRLALPVILASFCYVFCLFFWLGGTLVENSHAEVIPLQAPSLDEAKWWLGRPDTGWYFSIIEGGYKEAPYSSAAQQNWAFFPAYPLLMKFLSRGLSRDGVLITGWLVSLACFALAAWMLARLLLMDFANEVTARTLLLLCFYPFAFSLMIFGPDSLLLLCICASLYYARKERWLLAGTAAAVASATRVQGILLVPVLLYMGLRAKQFQWRSIDRSYAALLIAPSGLVAFSLFLWRITGDPLAFLSIQAAWGNQASYPFAFLINFLREPAIVSHGGWDPALFSVVVTCAIVPLLTWSWRSGRVPVEYSIFFTLQFIVLACRESATGNLRYVTGCFPFFLVLAILANRQMAFSLLLALFAGFLGLFAALFASNHQLGYNFLTF